MAVERTIEVKGMTCEGCENAVRNALSRLDGVLDARADHTAGRVTVELDDTRVTEEQVKERIRAAGYEA